MTPSFEELDTWTTGSWTSPLCVILKQRFPTSTDNKWGILRWMEENTEDENSAYVEIDILDSSNNVLRSALFGGDIENNNRFNKSINLALYGNVNSRDIKIRFKLFSLTALPVVSNIELLTANNW